jgi:hypothetical protein
MNEYWERLHHEGKWVRLILETPMDLIPGDKWMNVHSPGDRFSVVVGVDEVELNIHLISLPGGQRFRMSPTTLEAWESPVAERCISIAAEEIVRLMDM